MSQTKIPSFSGRKRTSLPFEKSSKESYKKLHALDDVTNTNATKISHSRMPKIADSNVRLMNRYYYGDVRVIEEVKKRERKIVRDIQHFRRSIAEIESETTLIKERNLPDLKYNISKKSAICDELRKDLIQLTTDLDEKKGECELVVVNGELALENLQLKHSVETQQTKNELDMKLNDLKSSWERKLREIENFKPDIEIVNEIEQLQLKKSEKEKELKKIENQHHKKCMEYAEKLNQSFLGFIEEKEKPLKDIREKQLDLISTCAKLKQRSTELDNDTIQCREKCESTSEEITKIQKEIVETEFQNKKLKEVLSQVKRDYLSSKSVTDEVQTRAHIAETHYNSQFDMMEHEQIRRRKLENSIDEMRGKVRCFAYVGDKIPDNCIVDYSNREIFISKEKSYSFSRIIPRTLIPEHDLFIQECQAYFEMCLNKACNCNIMSMLSDRPRELNESFIRFMASQEYDHIDAQYVSLSERLASSDMLIKSTEELKTEIKVRIEEEAIEMNSKSLKITTLEDTQEILELIRGQTNREGIGLLKLKVWISLEKNMDVYFVEINDQKTVEDLTHLGSPSDAVKAPVTIILQTLLSRTKSLVLFHLFDSPSQEISPALDLASKIGQLDNPRNKSSESTIIKQNVMH